MSDLVALMTSPYRKGAEVTERDVGAVHVTEIFGYPHANEAEPGEELIDMHFITVGVHRPVSGPLQLDPDGARAAFEAELRAYPQPDRLSQGPSYIEIGGVLGDQSDALRWMALGKVLDYWGIITPEKLGFFGADAVEMAGRGLVMIDPHQRLGDVLDGGGDR